MLKKTINENHVTISKTKIINTLDSLDNKYKMVRYTGCG